MAKLSIISKLFPSYKWKVAALVVCGVVVGGGGLFMYLLRAHTYLGDDPSACVNCHIMAPYYATWFLHKLSRTPILKELAKAHIEAKFAWDKSATEGQMKDVLALIRQAQWRWDFGVASHGGALHAPQEIQRVLSHGLDMDAENRKSYIIQSYIV